MIADPFSATFKPSAARCLESKRYPEQKRGLPPCFYLQSAQMPLPDLTLVFALLDSRTADIGIAKVSSHIEESGAIAVESNFAHICDIVGNALADIAVEQAAKATQPPRESCLQR